MKKQLDTESVYNKKISYDLLDIPTQVESTEKAKYYFNKHKNSIFDLVQEKLFASVQRGKKVVLVYQMGKVGSTSYTQSLRKFENLDVFHVHRLNSKTNDKMIGHFLQKGLVQLALTERKWQAIARFLELSSQPIYILSAMRNPVERNISAFFQNYDISAISDVEELIEIFLKSYSHDIPLKWFDEQFHGALGIDIYNYQFEKEKGWDTIRHKNYECLLMTTEVEDTKKKDAINCLLGTDLQDITRENIGSNKYYKDIYRKFKKKIHLPADYLDAQLNSKVVSHFYSAAQIEEFRVSWERKN